MNQFILSAYLAVTPPQGYDNPSQEALRSAGKALYKELRLDETVQRIEKKYAPKWTVEYGAYMGVAVRITTEKRISYTWRF